MKTLINYTYLLAAVLLLFLSTALQTKPVKKAEPAKKPATATLSKKENKACCTKPASRKALLVKR